MIALLLVAALQGAPSPAPESAMAATPAQPATDKAKEDPLVCKSETLPNSRLRKRVCLPRSQREARTEAHKSAWSAMQSRPVIYIEKGN
jgi:hypothetical protein